MKKRTAILLSALGAAVAAALWMPAPDDGLVRPAERPVGTPRFPSGTDAVPRSPAPSVSRVVPRSQPEDETENVFSSRVWNPPAQPAAAAAPPSEAAIKSPDPVAQPPAPPQAPPAPFRMIGRYEEAGQVAAFLEYQQGTLVARAGDQLTPEWKVESIESNRMVLNYLPLSQTQVLDWAGASQAGARQRD